MEKFSCTNEELDLAMDRMASRLDRRAFRGGFISAMMKISSGSVEDVRERTGEVRRSHTNAFANGFLAALDHFEGKVNKGTESAHELGLVEEYADFYGQGSFTHPRP